MSWRVDLVVPLKTTDEDILSELRPARVQWWYAKMNIPEGNQYSWIYRDSFSADMQESELRKIFPEAKIIVTDTDNKIPLDEVLEMLEKMRTCEKIAAQRARGDDEPEFNRGRATGYRNCCNYVEELVARRTGKRP